MADEFFLSGLDADQWFGSRFEGFHLFGYIGDREQLDRELHRKSLFRKIVEIAGRRVNIGSILKAVSGFDLIRVDPDKTLAADIIKLVTDQENSRKLNELLQSHYKKAEKDGTYFQGISRRYKQRNLFDADLSRLQGHLITVTGQIVHRSAVAQYSRSLDGTLKASAGEWILCDFPPHALIPDNKHFTGEVILLREDSGFTRTFRDYLPFCLDVCWYPYVRVTGFLDTSKMSTELLPSLSISLVEYRRPMIFGKVRDSFVAFAERELTRGTIYLERWSDWVLFAYLAPILFKGSNNSAADADPDVASLLRIYAADETTKRDLPRALEKFYSSVPEQERTPQGRLPFTPEEPAWLRSDKRP